MLKGNILQQNLPLIKILKILNLVESSSKNDMGLAEEL